jgi:glycosyltransferase involved in cell wall biosynthesis
MKPRLSYAAITPAREEADNLRRLGRSLLEQTVEPQRWIVVDNGSTDETVAVLSDLAVQRPWVGWTSIPVDGPMQPGAPIVRAFHEGLGLLDDPVDVVVKLDADVSMEPDYFERLLAAFEADPTLGLAGGICLEERDGVWETVNVTAHHIRGAVRAYRRACLNDLLPLEERMGWDGIDALKASVRGWRTETVPGLTFFHHRPVGARDGGPAARWIAQGEGAYYMGYRFSYLFLRSLFYARRDPAALAMLWAYARAALDRKPTCSDGDVREYVRRRQRLRAIPARALEALGRRTGG